MSALLSSFVPRHSSLITHHSSFSIHSSSLITHYSSLITHYSSLITHYSSLITHPSSLVTLRFVDCGDRRIQSPETGDRCLFVIPKIEQIVRAHGVAGEAGAGGDDRCDAAACRLHSAHSNAKKVLAAVAGLTREVRRLDPTTLEKLFQSRWHVQYIAHYAKAGTVSINIARGGYFSHLYGSKRLFRLHPVVKFPLPSQI